MKKLLFATAITALIWQTPASANEYKAEEKEVEAAFTSWRKALASGKAENVVNLYAKDAVLLATLSQKPITNQKDRMDYFNVLTAKPKLAASLTGQHIRMLDEDDAVISGLYTFSFEEGGKKVEIPARYSFVYEKQNSKWLIVEHHSSKEPINQ